MLLIPMVSEMKQMHPSSTQRIAILLPTTFPQYLAAILASWYVLKSYSVRAFGPLTGVSKTAEA